MYPAGTQPQFSAATSHTGLVTTPPAGTPPAAAMMLVPHPGQGPSAAPHGAMYAPTTPMQMGPAATPMQLAGMQMPQVGIASGGQNPGGRETQYNSFSLLAEGGGGVQYLEYPPANSLLVAPPPFFSSDAAGTGQIRQ